jgi:hypothetical protein
MRAKALWLKELLRKGAAPWTTDHAEHRGLPGVRSCGRQLLRRRARRPLPEQFVDRPGFPILADEEPQTHGYIKL